MRQYPVHRICLITLVNRALGCSGSDVLQTMIHSFGSWNSADPFPYLHKSTKLSEIGVSSSQRLQKRKKPCTNWNFYMSTVQNDYRHYCLSHEKQGNSRLRIAAYLFIGAPAIILFINQYLKSLSPNHPLIWTFSRNAGLQRKFSPYRICCISSND